jgi:hypothetical protein
MLNPNILNEIVSIGKIVHRETPTSVIVERNRDGLRVAAVNVSPEARIGDCGGIVDLDTGTYFMLMPYLWG